MPADTATILLDSDIRDWVVLPLFVIMVSAGVLRMRMGALLQGQPKTISKLQQRTSNVVVVTAKLKGLGSGNTPAHYLSSSRIRLRQLAYPQWLHNEATYVEDTLEEQAEQKNEGGTAGADDDLPNPMAMMDGMKGNMAFMIQNMVMMQAIQHFFSGFILLKVPFPLAVGFKQMFQRGLDGLQELHTSYVSSVSLYFLFMYGLRGFFKLVLSHQAPEDVQNRKLLRLQGYKPAGGGPPQQQQEDSALPKALLQEAENLQLLVSNKPFKSNLDGVEKRLLQDKYPKRSKTLGGGAGKDDFLLHAQSTKSKKSKKNN